MSPLQLIIYTIILSGLVWLGVFTWRHLGQSSLSKVLLFLAVVLGFIGLPLVLWGNPEVGGALLAVAGVSTAIEGYVRRKKSDTDPSSS